MSNTLHDAPGDEEGKLDVAARVRQARSDHEARRRAVDDGTAEPEVYEALEYAYEGADQAPDNLRDDARSYAVTLVLDAVSKAQRENEPIDPETIGKKATTSIRKTTESMAKGGVLGALQFLRPDTQTLGRVRSDLREARRPLHQEPELTASPLAEWRASSEARSERQTHALEGLLSLAERQAKGARVMLIIAAFTLIASVTAAAVAIIAP